MVRTLGGVAMVIFGGLNQIILGALLLDIHIRGPEKGGPP